ncbi:MAG: DNA-processing protein DprA [Acidimicrobiales bacterium]
MPRPPVDPHAVALALYEAADASGVVRRSHITGVVERLGGVGALVEPMVGPGPSGLEPVPTRTLVLLRSLINLQAVARWDHRLRRLRTELVGTGRIGAGAGVVSVGDPAYPANLALVGDRPPFLFHRGPLATLGPRMVAVVGTRDASDAGVDAARDMAAGLADAKVVVVSGLAAGIDAAAHQSALCAGGLTLGVLGHGIARPVYPGVNHRLADAMLAAGGALVSQFLPDQPPDRRSFLARNVTMSGLCLATVVVEAGERSGARQQARRCIEHGKLLFLLRRLVDTEPWARLYADRAGVEVVDRADQVLSRVRIVTHPRPSVPVQLALG